VIPGTSPNPDERQIALANRRGLAVSQSHFEIVNFGAYEWLDGDPAPRSLYNWTTNPDAMAVRLLVAVLLVAVLLFLTLLCPTAYVACGN